MKVKNTIQPHAQRGAFMHSVLPPAVPPASSGTSHSSVPISQNQLIEDFNDGVRKAPMSVRLSPHILSLINWQEPFSDPLFRQFIPIGSRLLPDHPELSLGETTDSPVKGLIHRYPDKAVFLGAFNRMSSLSTRSNP